MKKLGHFTKIELVKLLEIIEKEGIQVDVAFDKKFARLYKKHLVLIRCYIGGALLKCRK